MEPNFVRQPQKEYPLDRAVLSTRLCDKCACAGLDRQIDALVYDLYGLTPEEIQIVEGAK